VEAEQYDKADELNEAIDRLKRRIGGIATSAKQVAQKLVSRASNWLDAWHTSRSL